MRTQLPQTEPNPQCAQADPLTLPRLNLKTDWTATCRQTIPTRPGYSTSHQLILRVSNSHPTSLLCTPLLLIFNWLPNTTNCQSPSHCKLPDRPTYTSLYTEAQVLAKTDDCIIRLYFHELATTPQYQHIFFSPTPSPECLRGGTKLSTKARCKDTWWSNCCVVTPWRPRLGPTSLPSWLAGFMAQESGRL